MESCLCYSIRVSSQAYSSERVTISQRNFDPLTRTLRKFDRSEAIDENDTLEKNVAGVVEKVIAAHEETRVQELVCYFPSRTPLPINTFIPGSHQYST